MQPNQGNIIVPSGIAPVHGLDLWEVIVIQSAFGKPVSDAFRALASDQPMPAEKVEEIVRNYQGVLDKQDWALANKAANVVALEDPLWSAIYRDGQQQYRPSFDGILYQDALAVMDDIVRSGERFSVLTSGASPWVADGIAHSRPDLARALSGVYAGDKKKPETFQRIAREVSQTGGQLVSHTEDDLKVLCAARDSGVYQPAGLVYVERENIQTPAAVEAQGMRFTRNLRDVPYTALVQK